MPYLVDLDKATNGYITLSTTAPYQELGRVYGALNSSDKWNFPAESPLLAIVMEDLNKLQCVLDEKVVLSTDARLYVALTLATYFNEDLDLPRLTETKLHDHQIRACRKTLINSRFGLYMDCRTGKTLVALYTIKYFGAKALVIAPRIACENWVLETAKHFPDLKAISLYGETTKARNILLRQVEATYPDLAITSYENARIELPRIKELGYDTIIIDEAHRIKTIDAKRTEGVISLASKAKRRFLLTGTPTLGRPQDMYAQLSILSGAVFQKIPYWSFLQHFVIYNKPRLVTGSDGKKKISNHRFPVGYKNLEVLNGMIAPYIIRVRRDECAGLPDRDQVYTSYALEGDQLDTYTHLMEHNELLLEGVSVPIPIQNAAIKFQKACMICCGFVYYYLPDDPKKPEFRRTYLFKKNPKLGILKEYVEDYLAEPSNKLIVWVNWDAEQDLIASALKEYGVTELRGGDKGEDPFSVVKEFTEDPFIRVLVGKQSMGISVDMSVTSTSFNFSRNPSLDADIQSRDRIDGYKQKAKKICNYYMTGERTVETHAHELISRKIDLDKTLTSINVNCVGCKHLTNCITKQIFYGSSKCSYESELGKYKIKGLQA
jgi:hypothetical protein